MFLLRQFQGLLVSAIFATLATPNLALAQEKPAAEATLTAISAEKTSPSSVKVELTGERTMILDFYSDSIFRIFRDDAGGAPRPPESDPEAQILVDNPRSDVNSLVLKEDEDGFEITTATTLVQISSAAASLKVTRLSDGQVVLEQVGSSSLQEKATRVTLKEHENEYFYGGGVQNGRFSHKGQIIEIENQNSWTDGGVASPNPFYWSTAGYGIMWHTFKKGSYDFGSEGSEKVTISHQTPYLDLFMMIGDEPAELLAHYFQLTGKPVLLPKFGFYLGHLNAYNRDYWKEVDKGGVLFEDGKRYQEGAKAEGAIKESLNGEKDNYQFSARAVIERYEANDMPLGWILPNDGYGAGYGQTDSLEGNIQNLKEFGEFARERGVEIGLWTQSDLHPKEDIEPLLQRDIIAEVRDAGVRVLKTDVAWVGAGYSFGLNGIADAANLMAKHGDDARPFIITLDGWAGTQRYGGVWTGDQTGGKWEYIRFHIPTYLGAGLSGMSNICSDMDGIFGGKDPVINTRDYQWKTFTTMQLNMDGWGANPKYPHVLGEPATSINRWYLKWKSELMPYTYSIAKEAVDGLPMVRAMFLDEANAYTLGSATQYQFLYGPDFLVAPIYQDTRSDEEGNDERDNIYLPKGQWIDYFTGEIYEGGRIINSFDSPLWKLPTFVRRGAIIPKTSAHNDVKDVQEDHRIYEFYPFGESSFTEYNDDGRSERYKLGEGAETMIAAKSNAGVFYVSIKPTTGSFDGQVTDKSTELQINITERPTSLTAHIGKEIAKLKEVKSAKAYEAGENVFFYEEAPNLNRFATPDSEFAKTQVIKNPVLHVKLEKTDTTKNEVSLLVSGYRYEPKQNLLVSKGKLTAPVAEINDEGSGPYHLRPSWEAVANADYYEIEFEDMLYSTIRHTDFLFESLKPDTRYSFKVRAVNLDGSSSWQEFSGKTESNPYEFAIKGITATSSAPDHGGHEIGKLFDFDHSKGWHSKFGVAAVPFEFVMNLGSINQLDKLHYIPRPDASNGTLLKGSISHSMNGHDWTKLTDFKWEQTPDTKIVEFPKQPKAGYLKFEITAAVGNFGSGQELYVFKVPGSSSYIPGDINEDNKIDANDLTSYDNYTGLRQGDSDFEGYISKGDINNNGLIDAYDISLVTTRLDGGVKLDPDAKELDGTLEIEADKTAVKKGEKLTLTVSSKGFKGVNALSFALPYDNKNLKFEGIETLAIGEMKELTKDRLHTSGEQALYPTFVNIGNQPTLEGSKKLFVITFTAKEDFTFDAKPIDGTLVSKTLKEKPALK